MSTTAQQTVTSAYELRKRIAEAIGVHVDAVQINVSTDAEGYTQVDATIQIWDSWATNPSDG